MYGGMWAIPMPDLDRTDYLLMLGANPHASQGSLLAAADVLGRLDAIRARGGRSWSSIRAAPAPLRHADEWLPIRPGTDAALLLGDGAGAVRRGARAPRRARGPRERRRRGARARRASSRPRRWPTTCGVPAETIRRLARELAEAPRAAVYGRIGTCNQEFGTLASWLVEVLNILTGNLDREGGSMFSNPIAWSLTSLHAARVRERLHARPLEEPRARRARGARAGAGLVPGGGDRDARARARSRR